MKENTPKPHIPYDKALKSKSRELRKNATSAEKKFWNTLRKLPVHKEFSFYRQKPLGSSIVDFYCRQLNLVIEIDGDTHGTDSAKSYDEQRTHWLEEQGLRVIRFTNREVLNNIDGVMETMQSFIEKNKRKNPPNPL